MSPTQAATVRQAIRIPSAYDVQDLFTTMAQEEKTLFTTEAQRTQRKTKEREREGNQENP
jgi:hypothetical protein